MGFLHHWNKKRKLYFIDHLNIESDITEKVFSAIMLYFPIEMMPIETLKAIFSTS